jgi:hypothetical protein
MADLAFNSSGFLIYEDRFLGFPGRRALTFSESSLALLDAVRWSLWGILGGQVKGLGYYDLVTFEFKLIEAFKLKFKKPFKSQTRSKLIYLYLLRQYQAIKGITTTNIIAGPTKYYHYR